MERRHFLKTASFGILGLFCRAPKTHATRFSTNTMLTDIDSQGWITIPSDFLRIIEQSAQSTLTMSKMDGCLVAYPIEQWNDLRNKVDRMVIESDVMRKFRRFFVYGAFECPVDKQGRMLIPNNFRDYADLKTKAIVIRTGDHLEIWDWRKWKADDNKTATELRQDLIYNLSTKHDATK